MGAEVPISLPSYSSVVPTMSREAPLNFDWLPDTLVRPGTISDLTRLPIFRGGRQFFKNKIFTEMQFCADPGSLFLGLLTLGMEDPDPKVVYCAINYSKDTL